MKKRILIPTDFSHNALNAIKYALELLKDEMCEFYLFHSYYLPGYSKDNLLTPEPTEKELGEVRLKSEKNMEQLKKQMEVYYDNSRHSFIYLEEFGSFFETLVKTADEKEIELVIMGTQGQTDNKSVILGSNAVNVMEKVRRCPVMAIPANVVFKNPNEIVFPTNFQTHYKPEELEILVLISRLTHAPIRILHVQNEKQLSESRLKNKAVLEAILEGTPYTHHTLYDIDLKDGVRSFVQSRESEMIAFVNRKHNFFGSIFSNPMVKELGKHTYVPLLAMHDLKD